MPDVVNVGGGISGAAAAFALAAEGCSVMLLEAHRLAAMAAGWTLGGVRQSGRHPAEIPLTLHHVSVLQTEPLPATLAQVFGVANADCAGRQQIDGRLRVTTGIAPWTEPLAGWRDEDFHPRAADVVTMVERIGAILPAFRSARLARVWGGLIDLTPDGLPVLDAPAGGPGLVIAAGFSGHGFCLGPVTGQIVADLARGRCARHNLGAFGLARFAGDRNPRSALTLHG